MNMLLLVLIVAVFAVSFGDSFGTSDQEPVPNNKGTKAALATQFDRISKVHIKGYDFERKESWEQTFGVTSSRSTGNGFNGRQLLIDSEHLTWNRWRIDSITFLDENNISIQVRSYEVNKWEGFGLAIDVYS